MKRFALPASVLSLGLLIATGCGSSQQGSQMKSSDESNASCHVSAGTTSGLIASSTGIISTPLSAAMVENTLASLSWSSDSLEWQYNLGSFSVSPDFPGQVASYIYVEYDSYNCPEVVTGPGLPGQPFGSTKLVGVSYRAGTTVKLYALLSQAQQWNVLVNFQFPIVFNHVGQ